MINRYQGVILILCNYFGVNEYQLKEIFKEKENLYMAILLLNKYNCLRLDELMMKVNVLTHRKLKNKLREAEDRILINIDFRKRYFMLEGLIEENLRNA